MTKVYLKGRLGKVVGSFFKFNCRTLKEVFNAIEANTGKFQKFVDLNKKREFAVFIDGKEVVCDGTFNVNVKAKEVLIIPVLFGSFVLTSKAITAAILGAGVATTAVAFKVVNFIVGTILMTAFSFGMSLLMSKLMKKDDPEILKTTSFAFQGAENVTRQGVVVPVGYGRMLVGSRVISVNNFNVDKTLFDEGLQGIFSSADGDSTTQPNINNDYIYNNSARTYLGMTKPVELSS